MPPRPGHDKIVSPHAWPGLGAIHQKEYLMMRAKILMAGAFALALSPGLALAQKSSPPGNGQFNGTNYWHSNSGNANGQPGQSCEDLAIPGVTITPGNSATAPGGGSPFSGEDSTGGSHYAGSQPQNSRNTASVSQYDVACFNQLPPL
jgi:hypothetical protein